MWVCVPYICIQDFVAEGIRVQHRTSCTVQNKYTFLPDRKIKKLTGFDAASLDIAIEGIMSEGDVKSGVSPVCGSATRIGLHHHHHHQ